MTQRLKHCPNALNFETISCEKYISRLLQKEKFGVPTIKPTTVSSGTPQKYKVIKHSPAIVTTNQNQLTKVRPNVKQQNLPSPKHNQSPTEDILQYADNSALVEVRVKSTNPRQRSRSTVANREPWGQLLKQQKSSEKVSVFSNFDPLRTVHFLAKELQHHLHAALPEDNAIQQMVADMQYALKRVPPEVASAIHLQQAIDLLPNKKSSRTLGVETHETPEKLKPDTSEKITQTLPSLQDEEAEKLQRVMEESTIKLEASCKQLESLCEELKNEKQFLESQLKLEQDSVAFLRKRVEDLEFENNDILNPKVTRLEEEKQKLETELNQLAIKLETQSVASASELKSMVTELKVSKTTMEQECNKLKHQLRLCAIEKEKYVAVLAVRNKQINEIRSEMTQLQEVVNEQLMELHNNAFKSMPSNGNVPGNHGMWNLEHNKENVGDVGDGSLSTIHSNEDPAQHYLMNKPDGSFRDLPCGDTNILQEVPENYIKRNDGYLAKDYKIHHNRFGESTPYLDRPDSQASIRSMFSELKKTAYAIASNSRVPSQQNLNSNRQ